MLNLLFTVEERRKNNKNKKAVKEIDGRDGLSQHAAMIGEKNGIISDF